MICGQCFVCAHQNCTGFLKTDHAFCQCADRGHRTEEQQRIAELNEAIFVKAIQNWFRKTDEASR